MRYKVTLHYEAQAVAEADGPPDATEEWLREQVLEMCDAGLASFETECGETLVEVASNE